MSLEHLFREVAGEQDALRRLSDARSRVRQRVLSIEPAAPVRSTRRRAMVLAVAAAAAAALALLFFRAPRPLEPLTVRIAGSDRAPGVGVAIDAPESNPVPLRFSDGTHIEIAPSSRARLVELDTKGAHLLLESGRARVEVAHRPGARWTISTGPFTVRVTGTAFDVRWSPEQDQFELALEKGQVEIAGCVFGPGRQVAAGQTVRASCKAPRLSIAYPGSEPEAAAAGTPAPPSALEQPPELAPAANETAKPTAPSPARDGAWLTLARRGAYKEAFAAAHAAGFEAQCEQSGAHDVLLLGDAARHVSELAKAALAYKTVRRRFPGTHAAGLAAFALGRLEFDGHGAHRSAISWFQTYLKEQPGGELTREARGRVLEATHRSGQTNGARQLAARYLRDYPSGPHAALARRITAAP